MPSHANWINALPLKVNPKGVRLDLSLYVYPDGHGNIIYAGPDGNHPVNDLNEALGIFQEVWDKAQQRAGLPRGQATSG